MNIDRNKLTPMMKQYFEVKDRYPDCILFFRLGDFYEMFFEDAIVASKTLEIALTGKSCGLEERAPMCGVPFHSANAYISKLVENGYKVAIGEQLEDPASVKGIVKRDVIRVVTPGTVLDGSLLENKKNNYLMSLYKNNDNIGLTYVDISTGEVNATFLKEEKVIEEIAKVHPTEIILNDLDFIEKLKNIATVSNIYINENFDNNYLDAEILKEYFTEAYLQRLNFDDNGLIKSSLSILLNYIYNTQKQVTSNINNINIYNSSEYMVLDMFTRVNLELTQTIRANKKKGSLLHVLDKTSTAMGGRLLRKYVEEPLVNKERIKRRLDVIEEIKEDFMLREDLNEILKTVYDIERICGKIAFERVTPKELIHLKNSIENLPKLRETINDSSASILKKYIANMDILDDIYNLIEEAIKEDPGINLKEGNIIKSEFNDELKELRDISKNGAFLIKEIENREKEKLGVKSLKIGFNKVFGYFIEITKASLATANIDESYIRKQTLSNAERFITPELKEIEDKILNAEEKIKSLEYEIFVNIRNNIYENIDRIQKTAKTIANIDVFVSLATVAYINNYVKPTISDNNKLDIKNGRHPVVENLVGEENFVPNDTYLNTGENIINIITGPNMAGKSTYMRQTAIIALMAHIGSFVPAEFAEIPIMDRIFTRVGASDDLSQGQSTFMVEMSEVSHILKNATEKSLVILDEIGRGTSTYDGISLAWSIVEYIQNNIKCKTLFATHYHELTDLENEFSDVKNYSIAVKEDNDNIIFLRKIVPQGADKSYGIYVAELAKLPDLVIARAKEILSDLEKNHMYESVTINNEKNLVLSDSIDIGRLEDKYNILKYKYEELNRDYISLQNSYNNLDKENEELNRKINSSNMIKEVAISQELEDALSKAEVNIDSSKELELESLRTEVNKLEDEYNILKYKYEELDRDHISLQNSYNNLDKENEELNRKINSNNRVKEVAISQVSFDNLGQTSLLDEIANIDILNMTPLDAMNTIYMLQRKAKDSLK
ncbi:DNA mismatch repair protein MutS [Romboutsia sp. 1001216sp1]|uniref:DNA mismatch repair protein MutS n=1 Tax=Romboutsia sp. 1001216sp1 TaxID=2986997 RepID=UPI00232E53E7|nr:DNA mismatch repair protein MutS [Romboutsia sp. 1001216sp1]MDB8805951.1 DNA mismatch repair protein MutS [Romboutsia sp. 1001216sp1]MDB8807605.1 DNA mismatch repair protein MutS [Romboutsia sp. 1001216sp1]MDB8811228.1 DNA mismatch repair protein MutS [Romboutsia sp. 1001216sp1]MDB8816948.1 DNA mismatch repair protein MutS [Romboutsia sp. 1001216sp1]MDB8819534.1 DNA mismatch repair protein MutS [Romboutsia sp. 1001216sp1]